MTAGHPTPSESPSCSTGSACPLMRRTQQPARRSRTPARPPRRRRDRGGAPGGVGRTEHDCDRVPFRSPPGVGCSSLTPQAFRINYQGFRERSVRRSAALSGHDMSNGRAFRRQLATSSARSTAPASPAAATTATPTRPSPRSPPASGRSACTTTTGARGSPNGKPEPHEVATDGGHPAADERGRLTARGHRSRPHVRLAIAHFRQLEPLTAGAHQSPPMAPDSPTSCSSTPITACCSSSSRRTRQAHRRAGAWRDALLAAGCDWQCWRPSSWPSIVERLSAGRAAA